MATMHAASPARYRIRLGLVLLTIAALVASALIAGCGEDSRAFAPEQSRSATPPAGVIPVALDGAQAELWPYTGADLSGTPQDPINLVFTGQADPRAIRAALLGLGGDRTAFGLPAAYPFNCVWSDAIGDLQVAYTTPTQWVGSAIQLQCGNYGPVRFHLRLFAAGAITVANAHFELLIPGTADHQVLSWELAEQLVALDMQRTGLLDPSQPLGVTAAINQAPFRTIPTAIYDLLPPELTAAIGGPPAPAAAPVPIATDGSATIIRVAGRAADVAGERTQTFTIEYGQLIPKPFCATTPSDLVLVQGPVSLTKTVRPSGNGLISEFHASGRIAVTPIDAGTGQPSGAQYFAEIRDDQTTSLDDGGSRILGSLMRIELPPGGSPERGRLAVMVRVGTDGVGSFRRDERCDP
jgi:hypothetical protein